MAAPIVNRTRSESLKSEAALKRFRQRKSWFTMELMRQQANRYQMALDEAYYDNEQWTPDEAAEIRSRGQAPVVYNEVAPMVDFMLGTERRTRTDYEIMARDDDSQEASDDAEVKSKLMKYIEDINKAPFERSAAVDDQMKAGLGWIEAAAVSDPTKPPIRIRNESWRNMLHDSLGHHMMPEDWRYQFRFKEVDFDIADAMLPGCTDKLRRAVVHYDTRQVLDWQAGQSSGLAGFMPNFDDGIPRKWNTYDADAWVNNPRERLLLIECWATEPYKPTQGQWGGDMDDVIRMRKRVAIMTEYDTLIESWSPYRHGRFPFIPLWCYRRKKDGQPYGVIRRHRGPQDMLNKQMSKVHFRLATNQMRMEKSAIDAEVMDEEELRSEAAAPDGMLIFADGALSGRRVEIRDGAPMVEAELRLVETNKASIRQTSPVSGEDRGLDAQSVSGKARALREEQGSKLSAQVFDNIRMARQIEGEIVLALCEQYHVEPMVFSVPGEVKKREFVKINQPHPTDPGRKLNDISQRSAQFVIGEQPWNQALSEASFEAAMDMLGSLSKTAPQVVVSILDIVFELNPHLPKKARILQRIRQATGQPDPDKGPTPEQVQQNQEKQQMARAQFQAQLAELQQQVATAKAQGEKLDAEAFMTQVEGLYMAAQAAQIVAQVPQLAPVMDELAKSAGFVDKDGPPLVAPMQQAAAPVQPIPPLQGATGPLVGHEQGIRTPEPDGIKPGVQP